MNWNNIVIGVTVILSLLLILFILRSYLNRPKKPVENHFHAVIEGIKEMGELTALCLSMKEILSHKNPDKMWGIVKGKKMAVICGFEIEYRYDLRAVTARSETNADVLVLPPCRLKMNTGELTFYDEQATRFLGIPLRGFSTEERNQIIAEIRKSACEIAKNKTSELMEKIENSARTTMQHLFNVAHVENVRIEFNRATIVDQEIEAGIAKLEAA